MKIVKEIILWLFFLIAMVICGAFVLKIFDLLLKLEYENIWISGFKVGFIAWLGMIIDECYHLVKNKKK